MTSTAFHCPVCSGGQWAESFRMDSRLETVPRWLTRKPTVHAVICRCLGCGLEFTRGLVEPSWLLSPADEQPAAAQPGHDRSLGPRYTADPVALLRILKPSGGRRLLEAGFRDTAMLETLARAGWQAEGAGSDAGAVGRLKSQGLQVVLGDIFDPSLDEKRYDALVALEVLQSEPGPADFLRRCRALLVKGGVLLLTVPNPESLAARLGRLSSDGWEMYCEPDQLFFFGAGVLARLLEATGFKTLHSGTCSNRGRKYPAWLLRHLDRFRLGDCVLWAGEREAD